MKRNEYQDQYNFEKRKRNTELVGKINNYVLIIATLALIISATIHIYKYDGILFWR